MSNLDLFVIGAMLLVGLLTGLAHSWTIRRQTRRISKADRPVYTPHINISYAFLLLILFMLSLFSDIFLSAAPLQQYIPRFILGSFYLSILLLLMPLLRKFLYAESCVTLWVIIGVFFIFKIDSTMPRLTIPLPFPSPDQHTQQALFWIWITGAATILLWSILSHILFRRKLLENSSIIDDPATLEVYKHQLRIINFSTDAVTLVRSPQAKTPLSIGIFRRSTCIVLPEREYTPDELALVLHHELVHICRRDSQQKLFLSICTALMWFHPLMWLAMGACTSDLELSCDEAVLYNCKPPIRRQYAELLLQTAADPRGFTSCLSASARALRYRLKNVLKPGKRMVGSFFIGAFTVLILLSNIYIGFRYQADAASKLLFAQEELSQYDVEHMTADLDGRTYRGNCDKDYDLMNYIGALPISYTTISHEVRDEPRHMQIAIYGFGNNYILIFGGAYLRVIVTPDDVSLPSKTTYYVLTEEPDWGFMLSCIETN